MSEWDQVYVALGARTALEEALDWDAELVDYLMGAWAVQRAVSSDLPDDIMIVMMVGCLPKDKQKYAPILEKWLKAEYNLLNVG